MQRIREALARVSSCTETILSAVALAACWWAALWLLSSGRSALSAAGHPPTAIDQAVAAVSDPNLLERLGNWGWGAVCIAVAGALALSAAEGTWWLFRRVSRAT